jgi:hypothetical protein
MTDPTPTESWITFAAAEVYLPIPAYWPRYPFISPDGEPQDPEDDDPHWRPDDVWIDRVEMTPAQRKATVEAFRLVAANLLQHANALEAEPAPEPRSSGTVQSLVRATP